MVLEEILNKIGKRKVYSLFLGLLYVLISYGTAQLFFPNHVSIVMIFFITLLLIPSTARLVSIEERIERKDGLRHFWKDHATLIEIFLFLFIGIFIGYLAIGIYDTTSLSYQLTFLDQRGITGNFIDGNIPKLLQFGNIVSNNVSVIVIAFILSLFYGVGALFLIVLNASIFASFVTKVAMLIQQAKLSALLLSIHFIPEVLGFLLAALAGGVISKAIVRERFGSFGFRNVMRDAATLLILSLVVIVIAAFLEVLVTPALIRPFI